MFVATGDDNAWRRNQGHNLPPVVLSPSHPSDGQMFAVVLSRGGGFRLERGKDPMSLFMPGAPYLEVGAKRVVGKLSSTIN